MCFVNLSDFTLDCLQVPCIRIGEMELRANCVLSERTYDTEETPGLEHSAAIPKKTDNERESTSDDKNVGHHLDDIGIRFGLQKQQGAMRIQIVLQ